MFMFFCQTVYLGTALKELNDVRSVLEQNGIKYKYHIQNHEGEWLVPGKSTIRGNFGSAGMHMDSANLYEIGVRKKDFEQAQFLIRKLQEVK
jgi:hypothetical protein